MSDAEIVARAIRYADTPVGSGYGSDGHLTWSAADAIAAAVLGALTEAGRLVPEGCVAIDAGRWERVTDAAEWASAHTQTLLQPGDLGVGP